MTAGGSGHPCEQKDLLPGFDQLRPKYYPGWPMWWKGQVVNRHCGLREFASEVTSCGVRRDGASPLYRPQQMMGDGARMKHPEVLAGCARAITHPPELMKPL